MSKPDLRRYPKPPRRAAGEISGRGAAHSELVRRIARVVGPDRTKQVPFFVHHLGLMAAGCLGTSAIWSFGADSDLGGVGFLLQPRGGAVDQTNQIALFLGGGVLTWLSFRLAQKQHRRVPFLTLALAAIYAGLIAVLFVHALAEHFPAAWDRLSKE